MSLRLEAEIDHYPAWTRARKPELLKLYQDATSNGEYELTPLEIWWRDHYNLLESHGYRLRQRFHPDWKPSWIGTDIIPTFCEDAYSHLIRPVIDAVRIRDGVVVAVKQVPAKTKEIRISKMFSSPEIRNDTKNHCVPILDHFHDDAEPQKDFIIMPLLRPFDSPPFYATREVLDFIEQTLEGLTFLHEKNVAHRDCSGRNIMMDGSLLYPKGFHPSTQDFLPSMLKEAAPLRRIDVAAVKYYFVDFGLSSTFEHDDQPRLVLGWDGLDQEVPELRSNTPYDPFPVDVFILGNVYRKSFVNKYHNMDFIRALTDAMTEKDPQKRPTSAEALKRFRSIVAQRSDLSKLWRLRDKSEFTLLSVLRDLNYALREAFYMTRSIPRGFQRKPSEQIQPKRSRVT